MCLKNNYKNYHNLKRNIIYCVDEPNKDIFVLLSLKKKYFALLEV